MIKKNILKTILIATLTAAMLTACNKNTATVPDTEVTENTTIAETTVAETSGENLISTEATEDTKATETTTATTDTEDTKYPTTTASGYKDNTTEETTSSKVEETTTVKATETENTTTEEPVTEPTQPVIETTTEKQTEAPTQPETTTTTQTEKETTTQAPTEAPTQKPTEKPTEPETTTQAHVHNYTSTVTKASTCTENGIMTFTCSCGDTYTSEIGKLGHSFGEYVYNNDATTDADGTKTATCSVCGAVDTVTAEGTKLDRPKTDEELLAEITFHPFGTKAEINGSIYWSTGGGANDWVKSQGPWTGATLNVPIGDVEMPVDGIEIWFTDNNAFNDAMTYVGLYDWSCTSDVIGWYDEGHVRHGYTY